MAWQEPVVPGDLRRRVHAAIIFPMTKGASRTISGMNYYYLYMGLLAAAMVLWLVIALSDHGDSGLSDDDT